MCFYLCQYRFGGGEQFGSTRTVDQCSYLCQYRFGGGEQFGSTRTVG